MGLDMYLTKETFIGNKYRKQAHLVKVVMPNSQKGEFPLVKNIETKRVSTIIEEIGYWRKANAIHKWFVDNVQNGEDDCKKYRVSKEQLEELLGVVNKVLDNSKLVKGKITNGHNIKKVKGQLERVPIKEDGKYIKDTSMAIMLLPMQKGFFFGSDEYNQWYVEDLKDTKEILESAIKEYGTGDVYYQSSW